MHKLLNMDIQIFEKFARAPNKNFQVFNNFVPLPAESSAETPSVKRAANQAPEHEPPAKRYRLNDDEIAQGVTRLVEHHEVAEDHDNEAPPKRHKMNDYEVAEGVKQLVAHYRLDASQKTRLENVAKLTRYTPTVAEVEWVADEAKLRQDGSDLDIWMFAYMEYFPWYLYSRDDDHRFWTGAFRRFDGRVLYLYIGFKSTKKGIPKSTLYFDRPQGKGKKKSVFRPESGARCLVTWHTPLEKMFGLHETFPQDRQNDLRNKAAAAHQDEILKATMKVLARFPGLITVLDAADQSNIVRLYPKHSPNPFRFREMLTPNNPLAKLFDMLCSGSQQPTLKKTPKKTLKRGSDEEAKPKAQIRSNESPMMRVLSATKITTATETIRTGL